MKKISINEAINQIIEQKVVAPPPVRVVPSTTRPSVAPVVERPMPFGMDAFFRPTVAPSVVPAARAPIAPVSPQTAVPVSTPSTIPVSVKTKQMEPGILSTLKTSQTTAPGTKDSISGLAGPGSVVKNPYADAMDELRRAFSQTNDFYKSLAINGIDATRATAPAVLNAISPAALNATSPDAGIAPTPTPTTAPTPATAPAPGSGGGPPSLVPSVISDVARRGINHLMGGNSSNKKDAEEMAKKEPTSGEKVLLDLIHGIRGEFETGKSTPVKINIGRNRGGQEQESEDPSDRFLWSRWLRMPRGEQMNFRVENNQQPDISTFINEDLKKKVKVAVNKFLRSKEGKEIKNKYSM